MRNCRNAAEQIVGRGATGSDFRIIRDPAKVLELSVRFIDANEHVVRRDGEGKFPRWNESEMNVLETCARVSALERFRHLQHF